MAAHALARTDGGEEAHLVAAIVDAHFHARDLRTVGLLAEHRDQRQRQEAVRDRAAEGRELRLFLVDMDELMIARRVGEFVDHVLIDEHPFGCAQMLTDPGLQVLRRDGGHISSPRIAGSGRVLGLSCRIAQGPSPAAASP